MKKLSFFLMAMLFSVMSFAAEYTIVFKSAGSDSNTDLGATQAVSNVVAEGTSYVASFSECAKTYVGVNGIKLGSSKAAGTLNFNLATLCQENVKSIQVVSAKYSSDTGTLTLAVNGTNVKTDITPGTDYTHTYNAPTKVESIKLNTSSKRAYITKVIITTEEEVDPDAVYYTITTAVNDATMGKAEGGGEYKENTKISLTATPNSGYEFVKWSNESTANPLEVTVTEDATYTAIFQALTPITCSQIKDLAVGEAFILGEVTVTYVNGSYTYIKDATGASLIYSSNYGLKAGDVVTGLAGTRANYNGLVQITPTVTKAQLTVTAGAAPQPEVATANPTQADMNKYVKYEQVTFDATAFASKKINATLAGQTTKFAVYDQWSTGKTFIKGATYALTAAVSYYNAVQVNFISATKLSLTISATANGGTVTGTGEFMEGDEVTLTATPNEGYEFVNWTWGPEEKCKTAEYTFTVEEDMNLIANFKKIEYTVAATASEGGTVTGLAEEGKYEYGATATLTATANEGYEFVNWTEGEEVVATEAEYTFTVTENVTLVANFKEVVVEPTYDFDVVAKDLYLAANEVMTQFEGSNSMNPDAMISVTLFATEYGKYTSTGTDDDEFAAYYLGYQILGELTYSYSEEYKSDLVVIIGTITDEENVTSTVRITMYEEYLEPTDVVVLNNLSKTVQGRGPWASLMLHTALQDTIITISGCDGTYGKYTAWGTFGTLELEGKGEWKNEGENDVFVGVLYNADKTKVFQVTASTPAEAAPEAKEYRFEVSNIDFFIDLEGDFYIYCASEEDAEVPFKLELILYGWKGAGNYGIGEMAGTIYTIDYMDGADVANMNSEIEVIVEDGKVIIIGQVEDIDGNIYNLSLEGAEPQADDDDPTTGVENLNATVAPAKMIKNGQLIIRSNGVEFNAQGAIVK